VSVRPGLAWWLGVECH